MKISFQIIHNYQVEPLKNKTGRSTAEALNKIFKRMGISIILRSDRGLEYLNSHLNSMK